MGTYATGKAQKGSQNGASGGRGERLKIGQRGGRAQQGPWISFRTQQDPRGGSAKEWLR